MYRKLNDKQGSMQLLLLLFPAYYTASMRARAVIDEVREEIFFSSARYHADPERYGRENLRDTVVRALDLCATETKLPLGTLLTIFAIEADLTYEDLASEYDGRTPWGRRVIREAQVLRASGHRIEREARA